MSLILTAGAQSFTAALELGSISDDEDSQSRRISPTLGQRTYDSLPHVLAQRKSSPSTEHMIICYPLAGDVGGRNRSQPPGIQNMKDKMLAYMLVYAC